jgi:hypothetical protein
MNSPRERWQWSAVIYVYHAPTYGHRIEMTVDRPGRESLVFDLGTWKGLGIPADVLKGARATIDGVFSEHLAHRYGVIQELWDPASDSPEPF